MTTSSPILGIAFIGKDDRPILILPCSSDDRELDLELNLTAHSCLDAIETRKELNNSAVTPYLGFLSLIGRHATYGFIGPTKVKVLAVFDADFEPAPKDEDLLGFLTQLHQAYMDWLCNPFVEVDFERDSVPNEFGPGGKSLFARLKRICESHSLAR